MLAGPGCYMVTVSLDGQAAGSFRMDLRGAAPAAAPTAAKGNDKGNDKGSDKGNGKGNGKG